MRVLKDYECAGGSRLSTKALKLARDMLRRYELRVRRLHVLFVNAVMLKSGTDLHAQTYGTSRASTGGYSDPVVRRFMTMEALEEAITRAMRNIQPAIEVYQELKNSNDDTEREMFLIFERFYIGKESLDDIAKSLGSNKPETSGKSTRTLYRRKYELVSRVASKMLNMQAENGEKTEE